MVLLRTESIRYATNGSFGETINKFQDRDTKKDIRTLERKKKKLQNNKYFILFNQIYVYVFFFLFLIKRENSE